MDGLGSVVRTTNSAGAVTGSRRYDSFGNFEVGATIGYAFTGREWDTEADLAYYRARYYDPKVGRFLSEDSIGFESGVNFYTYVNNNPATLIDPSGHAPTYGWDDWSWWKDAGKWAWKKAVPWRLFKSADCALKHQECLAKSDEDCCRRYPGDTRVEYGLFAFTQETCKQMGASECLDEYIKCRLPWLF